MRRRQGTLRNTAKPDPPGSSLQLHSRLAPCLCLVLAVSCAHRTQVVRAAPPQPTAMERQVLNAVDAGDGDFRLRSLQERLAADPDNLPVRMELARFYVDRGSPELALEHYRLAAARYPASGELQLALARTLRRMGFREQAARSLESFLAEHPQSSPEFQSLLAISYDEQKRWAEGEKAHRVALALNPRLDYLHNNLGYNLLMQGKTEDSAKEFQQALELNPQSTVARNNLGLAVAAKPEQAVANWEAVSDPATAHSNLAATYIEQGRYAEARKELDTALGYNKYHPAALHNLRLVSELDGQPANIPLRPVWTPLHKVMTAVRKAVIGPDEDQPRSAGQPAPAETRRGL